LLGHRQPGGHGLVGRPVRDAHPPAVLPHRGARVQRGEAGPRDHAGGGLVAASAGAVWMALASTSQSYAAILPGLVCFGCGLAVSTAPITATAIHDVPAARLGVASALPNISRYTGGALGAALLGAILHAYLTTGLDRSLGQVAPSARDLVAEGFRTALLVAAVFLLAG